MDIPKLLNNNNWDKIYELLIKNKLKPNYVISNGNTICHMASINNNSKIILHYLSDDMTPLLKGNDEGDTPIHLLAKYNYTELLLKCIDHNLEFLNLLNDNNETIVNILYGDYKFIKHVVNVCDNNIIIDDKDGHNIITKNIDDVEYIGDKNYKIIKLLLDKHKQFVFDYDDSLLGYAIECDKMDIVDLLISYGYDVNKQDKDFITPFIHSIIHKKHDIAKLLIKDYKIDINYSGPENNNNPLVHALLNNDIISINLLIDNNFDVLQYDKYLYTPLHVALDIKNLSGEIILKLLYLGDTNMQNVHGQTPLHKLCKHHNFNNYSSVLVNKKLDIFIMDSYKKRPIDYLDGDKINDFIDLVVQSYSRLIMDPSYSYIIKNIVKCMDDVDTNECKNEIKKYIFVTERSIPMDKDKSIVNMKLINGNKVANGLFNANSLHNMIYTILILNKYDNLCIPFQYAFNDCIINTKLNMYNLYTMGIDNLVYDTVNIYNHYFYEISPYLILWKDKNVNYINKNFGFYIKKCLGNEKVRFIFMKLTLVPSNNNTHANIIIYDKVNNKLERFEPYGLIPYVDSYDLDIFIEDVGKKWINKKLSYIKSKNIGLQVISDDSNYDVKKLGDPGGFCLAWTYWFLEMRITNPDMDIDEIIRDTIGDIVKMNVTDGSRMFINFIRNYANDLDKEKNEFLIDAGIDEKNIYNLDFSNGDNDKIINKLRGEFWEIIKKLKY